MLAKLCRYLYRARNADRNTMVAQLIRCGVRVVYIEMYKMYIVHRTLLLYRIDTQTIGPTTKISGNHITKWNDIAQ